MPANEAVEKVPTAKKMSKLGGTYGTLIRDRRLNAKCGGRFFVKFLICLFLQPQRTGAHLRRTSAASEGTGWRASDARRRVQQLLGSAATDDRNISHSHRQSLLFICVRFSLLRRRWNFAHAYRPDWKVHSRWQRLKMTLENEVVFRPSPDGLFVK